MLTVPVTSLSCSGNNSDSMVGDKRQKRNHVKRKRETDEVEVSCSRNNLSDKHDKAVQACVSGETMNSYMIGTKECGALYKIKDQTFAIAVKEMNLKSLTATGILVSGQGEGVFHKDVLITVPVGFLGQEKPRNTRPILERKLLETWFQTAFQETAVNLQQTLSYRMEFRRQQVAGVVQKEVTCGLKCRAEQRRFVLGPVMPDVDLGIFHLSDKVKTASFGYAGKRYPLQHLDGLIGLRWDVFQKEEGARYVTCLRIHVRRGWTLVGTVYFATCRSPLNQESARYRDTLEKDILSASDPVPDEDEEDSEVEAE